MLALLTGCFSFGPATPLGVSLDDGQVLVGEVTTPSLVLEGVFGEIDVPLEDIGVVLPVEASTFGQSRNQVTVWLRNGSELRGRWKDPALALSVSAGGEQVLVDLAVDHVQGLQLKGGEEWPDASLYRIRTTHGDDVLVDPAETRISISNALGTFAPFLTECAAVGPVGDPAGDWKVVLRSGTVLVGPLSQDHLVLALPSGPAQIDVPLDELVAIDQRVWSGGGGAIGGMLQFASSPAAVAPSSMERSADLPESGRQGLGASDGWFDNRNLRNAKR